MHIIISTLCSVLICAFEAAAFGDPVAGLAASTLLPSALGDTQRQSRKSASFKRLYPDLEIDVGPNGMRWRRITRWRDNGRYASWMRSHEDKLRGVRLVDVTFPGSHDSAAYALKRRIIPGALPWPMYLIVQLAADAGLQAADYVIHWALAQNYSITEQLNQGIRFLDLRAGFDGSKWVTCHTAEGPDLEVVIKDVRRWLHAHPLEIVLVELTHVYHSHPEQLNSLQELLWSTLGNDAIPCCQLNVTFGDVWRRGRRLLLSASVPPPVEGGWWFGDMVQNSWANTDDIVALWYFNQAVLDSFHREEDKFYKLSWILTAEISTLVHGLLARPSTLKDLASEANPLLQDFVHVAFLEGKTAFPQVLIADFFETADVVPLALYINGLIQDLPAGHKG